MSQTIQSRLSSSPRVQRVAGQFVRFLAVGTIGAAVDFSVYGTLTRGLDFTTTWTVLGLPIIAANVFSVLIAMVPVFLLNKYWTIGDRQGRVGRQGAVFFTLYATTYVLNQILTGIFAFRVPFLETWFGSRVDFVAKVLAVGVIVLINFAGIKLVVFRSSPHRALQTVATAGEPQGRPRPVTR